MISIFVMYSADRECQFRQMDRLMTEVDHYADCERILVVDDAEHEPSGWRCVTVPRVAGVFNWARMWDAGVGAASNDIVVYLDSDRVLPRDYLSRVLAAIDDDRFLYTHDLFNFRRPVDDDMVRMFRDGMTPAQVRQQYDRYKDLLWYDPRFGTPCDGFNKGAMSGSTAFTKSTFARSGGVDPWFCGQGAWADHMFHRNCHRQGFEFVDLGLLELHLHHEKTLDNGATIARVDLEILSLINYIRYSMVWGLDFDRPRTIARDLKLEADFVARIRRMVDDGTVGELIEAANHHGFAAAWGAVTACRRRP